MDEMEEEKDEISATQTEDEDLDFNKKTSVDNCILNGRATELCSASNNKRRSVSHRNQTNQISDVNSEINEPHTSKTLSAITTISQRPRRQLRHNFSKCGNSNSSSSNCSTDNNEINEIDIMDSVSNSNATGINAASTLLLEQLSPMKNMNLVPVVHRLSMTSVNLMEEFNDYDEALANVSSVSDNQQSNSILETTISSNSEVSEYHYPQQQNTSDTTATNFDDRNCCLNKYDEDEANTVTENQINNLTKENDFHGGEYKN